MKRLMMAVLTVLCGASAARADTYQIDPMHTTIEFKVKHMMVSWVHGKFDTFTGSFDYDPKDTSVWRASATISAGSIDTGVEPRDNHLRSDAFLNAVKYPVITFVTTGVDKAKDGTLQLRGNLTIRDVTQPVVLALEEGGQVKGMKGETRAGFSATTKIDRTAFGAKWNAALENGGVVVGDDVYITLEVEGVKK